MSIQLVGWLLLAIVLFYYGFIIYAGATKAWHVLGWLPKVMILPLAPPFYLVDVLFNTTIGSLIYLQWPKYYGYGIFGLTFSIRTQQNAAFGTPRRKAIALSIVKHFLYPFAGNNY